jgi:starch synthase
MMTLSLLSVASEIYPLIKTGGLADVAGALPAALAQEDVAVTSFVPGYPAVLSALGDSPVIHRYKALMGGPAAIRRGEAAGLDLLVLDAPHLFDRNGNPYLGPDGRDWPDNALRFGAFSRAAADVGSGRIRDIHPDVVQLHDWQAGLTSAYLHYNPSAHRPGVVATIHNLAFQGVFPAYLLGPLDLPAEAFALDALEYHGQISFLKSALIFADRITTVSPTYASEISTEEHGMGLYGLIAGKAPRVSGILNGIDAELWDPADDPFIAANYSTANLGPKATNKAELQRYFGLAGDPEAFLLGSVGRLTEQKGLDLLLALLPEFVDRGVQLALLGSGDPTIETAFSAIAAAHPSLVGCQIGYDETLAHRIEAAADAFVVPSRFEPCGLTQLYALRYGTIPIVAHVGGLVDTVIDAGPFALRRGVATGFQFSPGSLPAMRAALDRAYTIYKQDRASWNQIQRNGMSGDYSWSNAAKEYAALFRAIASKPEA